MINEAYLRLHLLSWTVYVDNSELSIVRRIAIFLSMVPFRLSWSIVRDDNGLTIKDKTLECVLGLENSDWDVLYENMIDHMPDGETTRRRTKRIEWIRALDTFREFER